ncbi:MAG TPA: GNAT family N-acetyltransferase [Chloroflexaceae bacterium]|nr:GNAT family N-acetyltransferase [Chloroflexaceae bacterium]
MEITITPERPDTADASTLIAELEDELAPLYPATSRHGYSVERLLAQGVAFFVLRADGAPAGCGGVQLVGAEYGELKRMFVRPAFRGRGLAGRLLATLEGVARERGAPLLRLETGVHQREAIALYRRYGFAPTGPFGPYNEDPLSLFFEKPLT